jgi:hypothetical protein
MLTTMESDKAQPYYWLGLCILGRTKARDSEGARQTMPDHLKQDQDLFEMVRGESETTSNIVNARLESGQE